MNATRRKGWLLPDGVDEMLPPRAEALESLRRAILDLFRSWGYLLVDPPLVEFLESLLSGVGEDLELQTFKLTDQVSGRLMGLRADMTPQVARIDAHRLRREAPQRLCYIGPVLHTVPDKFAGSRNPLQAGAELYGHAGIESDAEILSLTAAVLARAGLAQVTFEIGHMGVFKALVEAGRLDRDQQMAVLAALLRKDRTALNAELAATAAPTDVSRCLAALLDLSGDISVLAEARRRLAGAPPAVAAAVDSLRQLSERVLQRDPGLAIHVDLAELRGYHYHTGVTFAAYTPAVGRAIAWGGRYDFVGERFGNARPATGFSTDLKALVALGEATVATPGLRVFAPEANRPDLRAAVERLRAAGTVVVEALPGTSVDAATMGCGAELRFSSGEWRVETLEGEKS